MHGRKERERQVHADVLSQAENEVIFIDSIRDQGYLWSLPGFQGGVWVPGRGAVLMWNGKEIRKRYNLDGTQKVAS